MSDLTPQEAAQSQLWYPDTCHCVLEVKKGDWSWVSTVSRCKLHSATGAAHLAEVLAHHKPFNDLSRYSSNKSDQAKDKEVLGLDETGDPILGDTPKQKHLKYQSVQAKAAEKERSR